MHIMKSTLLALFALTLCASAHADVLHFVDDKGRSGYSDRAPVKASIRRVPTDNHTRVTAEKLPGTWRAQSSDGIDAEFRITDSGSFVFDRRDNASPARRYLCGNWSSQGKLLTLDVRSEKEQFENGVIEQRTDPSTEELQVLAATSDLLVIRFEGRTFNFRRTGT